MNEEMILLEASECLRIVWRDVKHSTSAWRGGAKNTHDQSEEAGATILMIYLLRWSFKVEDIVGCTHLLV